LGKDSELDIITAPLSRTKDRKRMKAVISLFSVTGQGSGE